MSDPKLLTRKQVLECYAALDNRTISDGIYAGLLNEIFEHVDAQGRLLARAGNLINRHQSGSNAATCLSWSTGQALEILADIKKAMA